MRDLILTKLNEIERQENVKILIAVESGSRAWGLQLSYTVSSDSSGEPGLPC